VGSFVGVNQGDARAASEEEVTEELWVEREVYHCFLFIGYDANIGTLPPGKK
jgi:hypothetical protein